MTTSPLPEELSEALKDTQINHELVRSFFYHHIFTPEQCLQISSAEIDPDLTRIILEQQYSLMPGYLQYMQGDVGILALNEANRWLHEYIHNIFRVMRDKHYRYEIDRAMGTQLLSLEAGQSISFHNHLGEGLFAKRKIALVVFLTPPEAYDGGSFEIIGMPDCREMQLQGSILAFPAFSVSRISVVARGPVQFLQSWMYGTQRFC